MRLLGPHGVYPHEREEQREFLVDVIAEVETFPGFTSDRFEETLDYNAIAEIVVGVIQGPSRMLIERLSEEIAQRVLALSGVHAVEVLLKKHALGVAGHPRWVAVRIRREEIRG